jgi:hypothetical protein
MAFKNYAMTAMVAAAGLTGETGFSPIPFPARSWWTQEPRDIAATNDLPW